MPEDYASLIERREIEPHEYWPDYQAMGDCVTCGNTREDCERFQATISQQQGSPQAQGQQNEGAES